MSQNAADDRPGEAMSDVQARHVRHALAARRRRPQQASPRLRRRRLRMVYFGMASVWGFVAGTVAMMMGVSALKPSMRLDGSLTVRLGVAMLIAVVGGIFVSLAYREAVRRGGD